MPRVICEFHDAVTGIRNNGCGKKKCLMDKTKKLQGAQALRERRAYGDKWGILTWHIIKVRIFRCNTKWHFPPQGGAPNSFLIKIYFFERTAMREFLPAIKHPVCQNLSHHPTHSHTHKHKGSQHPLLLLLHTNIHTQACLHQTVDGGTATIFTLTHNNHLMPTHQAQHISS